MLNLNIFEILHMIIYCQVNIFNIINIFFGLHHLLNAFVNYLNLIYHIFMNLFLYILIYTNMLLLFHLHLLSSYNVVYQIYDYYIKMVYLYMIG